MVLTMSAEIGSGACAPSTSTVPTTRSSLGKPGCRPRPRSGLERKRCLVVTVPHTVKFVADAQKHGAVLLIEPLDHAVDRIAPLVGHGIRSGRVANVRVARIVYRPQRLIDAAVPTIGKVQTHCECNGLASVLRIIGIQGCLKVNFT